MRRLILVLLLIGAGVAAANGACLGKITGASALSSLSYSPFAAQDTSRPIFITIQNTANQPCTYQLSIPSASYPLRLGVKLAFAVTAAGAIAPLGNLTALSLTTSPVQPGQTVKVPLALTIFRGQPAVSGQVTAALTFVLSLSGALPSQPPLDQVQIPVSCAIPAIFEINIAGSGQHTTVDFGELSANKSATVVLQTRATADHSLHFKSQNGGYLTRNGASSSDTSRIPYSLTVDGQPVVLSGPAFLQFRAQAGESSRRFLFTIGDTSKKAAGIYKDTITVRIASLL